MENTGLCLKDTYLAVDSLLEMAAPCFFLERTGKGSPTSGTMKSTTSWVKPLIRLPLRIGIVKKSDFMRQLSNHLMRINNFAIQRLAKRRTCFAKQQSGRARPKISRNLGTTF